MQKNPAGQVGLVLLLVMAVIIALALSLASRSLSDTVLSRQEVESNGAFQLAETGVEAAMQEIRQNPGAVTLPPSFTSGIFEGTAHVDNLTTYSLFVKEGEQAHLDLTGFAGTTLAISWTKTADSSENIDPCTAEGSGGAPAAIEVIAVNATANTVARSYYNPSGTCAQIAGNGFSASNAGANGYRSTVSYAVPASTSYVRIHPIYNGATIEVTANGLATQMYLVQAEASGGDANKEIEVHRTLDAPASIFDYALFSGSTIIK